MSLLHSVSVAEVSVYALRDQVDRARVAVAGVYVGAKVAVVESGERVGGGEMGEGKRFRRRGMRRRGDRCACELLRCGRQLRRRIRCERCLCFGRLQTES